VSDIGSLCNGQWRMILSQIGIDQRFLSKKNGPCPVCGGKDRFRFTDLNGSGSFYCNNCNGGNGFELVKLFKGVDFHEAINIVAPIVGAEKSKPRQADPLTRQRWVWGRSESARLTNATGRYLRRRCGIETFPQALRHVARLLYENTQFHPGMVARVSGPTGASVQVYRTYLAEPDQKAPVEVPRKMMFGSVPPGSAVRLAEPCEGRLGIAEGIETAISAGVLFKMPVWAAIGTTGLSGWVPPDGIKQVVIFADHDKNYAGHSAAYTLAHRLALKGIEAKVEVPPSGDWNDVHLGADACIPVR
jgi:putative DNA primase/helicase